MLRLGTCISVLMIILVSSVAASPPRPLYDISLDMDGNGLAERAVLVINNSGSEPGFETSPGMYSLGGDETVDLLIYMDAGAAPLDISKPASFQKLNIIDRDRFNWVGKLESNGKQSLKLYASYAPGSTATGDETLIIAYRKGKLLVAGIEYYWEGGGKNGNCQYNFLTRKGHTAEGEFDDNKKAIKAKVKAIPLDKWSPETRSTVCDPG